jgi:iron complex outermembrane receptor protein
LAQANGAVDLEPEESDSRSLGFTWSNDAFNLSFDYYQIDIDDRIVLGGTLSVVGVPGIEGIRFFSNAIDTETKGFDLVASYTLDQWNFAAAYNDSDTDIVNSPAGFSIEEVNTLETAAPENKFILSSIWANDRVSVLVRGIRYGETQRIFDFGGGFEPTQTYSEEWSIDTDIQFNITDAWSVAIGANNLLDEYPDESIFDISFFGNLPYDGGISPLGVNGRFVYVRSSFDF